MVPVFLVSNQTTNVRGNEDFNMYSTQENDSLLGALMEWLAAALAEPAHSDVCAELMSAMDEWVTTQLAPTQDAGTMR